MGAMKDVVEYNGMLLHYKMEMPYKEFCERNVQLETRVAWDETTSEAMDAYYYCKEKLEREAMRQ